MQFEIGNAWHWLFIAGATTTSAWNACRVFSSEYEGSHLFSIAPFYAFWYELAATMAGWMGLWSLWPSLLDCAGETCRLTGSLSTLLLGALAVLAVMGLVPKLVERIVDGVGRLAGK